MIHLEQAVVVEGRYDKIKLDSILDTTIVETNGFRIFHDPDKISMLRELAKRVGLVVLTDSDTAGFKIRNYIKNCVREGAVYHAYIPEILGKESRKAKPSAEGTLGVEGVPPAIILEALERAGISGAQEAPVRPRITKTDFYCDGLTGGANSRARREQLLKQLHLPRHLSANSMLDVLNCMMSPAEYHQLVAGLRQGEGEEPT